MIIIGFCLVVALLAFFLFKNTMNRLQYVAFLRIYWITRNTGVLGTPYISSAFMKQTSSPWWNGKGIQFRCRTYTFQIGVLTYQSGGLIEQLGGRYLEETPKEIRSWR